MYLALQNVLTQLLFWKVAKLFLRKTNRKEMPGFLTAYESAIPKWKFMAKIKGTSVASSFLYDEFQRLAASEMNFI